MRITDYFLKEKGFKIDNNGNYWKSITPTHAIILIKCKGYYYPSINEAPELSCEDEQEVSLNRITKMSELQTIIDLIK